MPFFPATELIITIRPGGPLNEGSAPSIGASVRRLKNNTLVAPNTVNNFVVLARYHFFDNTICHRAIPGFAVQCGDPTGTGSGGPGYSFVDELPSTGSYKVGSIAMANTGQAGSTGSQFFICHQDLTGKLPKSYTLFGQVTKGMDVVNSIKQNDAVTSIRVD